MSRVRQGVASIAVTAMLVGALGACSVGDGGTAGGTVAPSVNPTGAGTAPRVDQTKLPADWPSEAATPEGLTIVSVTQTAGGSTVMGTVKGTDAIKTGDALKATWEKNGVLISESTDQGGTFSMAGLTKDGKTQLTATLSKGSSGTLSVILTSAPAA